MKTKQQSESPSDAASCSASAHPETDALEASIQHCMPWYTARQYLLHARNMERDKQPRLVRIKNARRKMEALIVKQRGKLLEKHHAKWGARRKQINAECAKECGHRFVDLPDNGFNSFNMVTGQWPRCCEICRMHAPLSTHETEQPNDYKT